MTLLQFLSTALALATTSTALLSPHTEKQFSQSFLDGYNILKYTGGLGPYSDRVSYGISRDPPTGCTVDQVAMIMRHGERYPDASTAAPYEAVLAKIYASNRTSAWGGDLSFLSDWSYYVPDKGYYSQETTWGPYAGLLNAFHRGADYRSRYGHLWDGESVVPIFAGGYERVVETARKFGEGFFGYNYSTVAAINIISENATQGADSLTPTCPADTSLLSCFYAVRTFPAFNVAAARFNAQNPGLNLNSTDILSLMGMAAFELNARPFSPWVSAFTQEEWVAYGYVQDLTYYYCSGPGDPYQIAVGQVYANATLQLLKAGPASAGSMFWSFSHDAYITPIVAALGLDSPASPLSNTTIQFPTPYSASDIVPMGGHLTLERLSCAANSTTITALGNSTSGTTFVRAVINEAVVPFPTCQSGPGYSCPLAAYETLVGKVPRFSDKCQLASGVPADLQFFWNWNKTTALDYRNGSIAWQETYTSD